MRWISYLNLGLIAAALTASSYYVWIVSRPKPATEKLVLPRENKELPKNPFAQPLEAFESLGHGPFSLKWVAPRMQLPDLRKEILFAGKNGRPDVTRESPLFHLLLKGSGQNYCARAHEKVYLSYQGAPVKTAELLSTPRPQGARPLIQEPEHMVSKGMYAFSPHNRPTPLWLEVSPAGGGQILVTVHMLDDRGQPTLSPPELHSFSLPLTEQKHPAAHWDLDGIRVDTTLLVRQRARWVGHDLFMAMHGGEEFASRVGRERIDFLDGNDLYSCFVSQGSYLTWNQGRWREVGERTPTVGKPLLVVKSADEKIMQFELWDEEGKNKTPLSLIRTRDHTALPNMEEHFKFVGAKSWGQFIVECKSERLILKPQDWLVLTHDGWRRLESADDVDAYVSHSIIGPLFILDKLSKQNGRSVLIGHLFNSARTEVQDVELPAASTPLVNHYIKMDLPPLYRPPSFNPSEESTE